MGIFDSPRAHPGESAIPPALGGAAGVGSPSGAAPPAGGLSAADARAGLERRRDELLSQVAELHWDLGGLAYEMAIRDHFRLDVLVRKAAELQERDAELGELERVLSLRGPVDTGTCPGCGAVHGRGALYCWHCGKVLMERAPTAADGAHSQPDGGEPPHGQASSVPVERQGTEAQTLVRPPSAPVG
ncbi:MAG TPA: hypothetical protein VNV37_02120 [Solirubrobacteraceae bacterium]|jgi:hypothetical protein|nr:hypothetical protein [Solirubrobacteraceae bacterium]